MALPRGPGSVDCRIGCFWLTYLVGQRPLRLRDFFLNALRSTGRCPRGALPTSGRSRPGRRYGDNDAIVAPLKVSHAVLAVFVHDPFASRVLRRRAGGRGECVVMCGLRSRHCSSAARGFVHALRQLAAVRTDQGHAIGEDAGRLEQERNLAVGTERARNAGEDVL